MKLRIAGVEYELPLFSDRTDQQSSFEAMMNAVVALIDGGGAFSFLAATGDTTDRTADIQAVLDGKGVVMLGSGTFWCRTCQVRSDTLLIMKPDTILKRIEGSDPGTTVLALTNVSNVVIRGGTVDGNGGDLGNGHGIDERAHNIYLQSTDYVFLDGVTSINAPTSPLGGSYGDGINGANAEPAVKHLYCRGVKTSGNGRCGMQVGFITDSVWEDCQFVGDGKYGGDGGAVNMEPAYDTYNLQRLTYRHCTFTSSSLGVTANNHYSGDWQDILFDNCYFVNNVQEGISTSGAGQTNSGLTFRHCVFRNNGSHGAYIIETWGTVFDRCIFRENDGMGLYLYTCRSTMVQDCDFINNTGSGLFMFNDEFTLGFINTVLGCKFFNNGTGLPADKNYAAGIFTQGDWIGAPASMDGRLMIALNWFGNLPVHGDATQQYGITLTGRCSRGTARLGNRYINHGTADVYQDADAIGFDAAVEIT